MLLFVVSLGVALQASPADQAIDAAVAAYARVHTAHATFEQTVTNALTGTALKSRGQFDQQRPDRFSFRFTQPAGDEIVSDGKYVWLYLPSSSPGQVIRSPVSSDAAGSLDLIGEFFTNPRSRYTITDGGTATIGNRSARIVNLAPKTKDASFVSAKVWIDPGDSSLVQFEAEEQTGVTRLVHILSFTPNAVVSAASFRFSPPKGVKVVDQGPPGRS